MKLVYPALFTPFEDGSGGYTVEFPDLPGCVTEGQNMAEDAASGWVSNRAGRRQSGALCFNGSGRRNRTGAACQSGCSGYGCICSIGA